MDNTNGELDERKWLTLHGVIVVPASAEYFNKIPGANVPRCHPWPPPVP